MPNCPLQQGSEDQGNFFGSVWLAFRVEVNRSGFLQAQMSLMHELAGSLITIAESAELSPLDQIIRTSSPLVSSMVSLVSLVVTVQKLASKEDWINAMEKLAAKEDLSKIEQKLEDLNEALQKLASKDDLQVLHTDVNMIKGNASMIGHIAIIVADEMCLQSAQKEAAESTRRKERTKQIDDLREAMGMR